MFNFDSNVNFSLTQAIVHCTAINGSIDKKGDLEVKHARPRSVHITNGALLVQRIHLVNQS